MKDVIIIAGSFAQKPLHGGHSWVLLQYILGFKRLGWMVIFLDSLTSEMCFDLHGKPCSLEQSLNWQVFQNVMNRFGLEDNYSLIFNEGEDFIGLSRQQVLEYVGNSVFLLNIMGFLENEEILAQVPRHVFLDIDPGFGQMWTRLGLTNLFEGFDEYVTIGEHIGKAGCRVPDCGLSWITTPQPVLLDQWPVRIDPAPLCMSSIISWRGAYDPVSYNGHTYGLRVHEFRKFIELPLTSKQKFQLALSIHPDDATDLDALKRNNWEIVDPVQVAGDPWSYRSYIQNSSAEIMVAKNMYVDTCSGWFSDRSICYLASGKPVLAQDTGLEALYPTGEGLLLFRTPDEACEGIESLRSDYGSHARAARAIAEEYFDSDRVLGNLLRKLGVG